MEFLKNNSFFTDGASEESQALDLNVGNVINLLQLAVVRNIYQQKQKSKIKDRINKIFLIKN